MNRDYRQLAREALVRAKSEVESGDPHRLRYAALELREAMEAITYSKAESYKDELPNALYRTWQPRKVLRYLAEIDPRSSYVSSTLRVGIETEPGKAATELRLLGTETPLTIKNLQAHYDALGSFLHIPTLAQFEKGSNQASAKLLRHCEDCIAVVDKVLKSTVWNSNIGQFVQIDCERCDTHFRWRYDADAVELKPAICVKCDAEYIVVRDGDKLRVEPKAHWIDCPNADCSERAQFFIDDVRPGLSWTCKGCNRSLVIGLTVFEQPSHGAAQ